MNTEIDSGERMNGAKVRCVIGVVCLLLAGCGSPSGTDIPPNPPAETIASPTPTDTRPLAQASTTPPTPIPATLTPAPPAYQFQCGSDIREIAYSPDGALLAALGKQRITICDMSTLSERVTLETESEITGGIDWSPQGTRLVAGLATGQVRIWDAATWQEVITYQASDPVNDRWDVVWSPDGYRLLTTSPNTSPHIWHASTGEELLSIEETYPSAGGAWSPDSKQIVLSGSGLKVVIRDAATGQSQLSTWTYFSSLWSTAWSSDGTRFAVGFHQGTLTMFDAKTGEALFSLDGTDMSKEMMYLDHLTWSVDSQWLSGVSSEYTSSDPANSIVYIWEASTGQGLATIGPFEEPISLDRSPDGKYLAGGMGNGTVYLWEPHKLVRTPEPLPDTSLTPEGPWYVFMASVMWDGPPYLWAVNADGTGLTKLSHEPIMRNFAVRPTIPGENGTMIAFPVNSSRVSEDNMLKIMTLPSGEIKASIPFGATRSGSNEYHSHYLWAAIMADGLKWSPDGSRLAFPAARNGDSADISLYDANTGAVTRITTGENYAHPLEWSPDGRYLIYERFTNMTMGYPIGSEIWAARTDGTGEVPLVRESKTTFLGWRGLTEGIFNHWGSDMIEMVNIETGKNQTIVNEEYHNAAFAEEYNALLIVPSDEPNPDTPLILVKDGERIETPGRQIRWVQWDSALDLFFGWGGNGSFYISPDGQYVDPPQSTPPVDFRPAGWSDEGLDVVVSPDKTLWAWRHHVDGTTEVQLWIGEPMAEPTTKILSFESTNYVADITWSPDSQSLFFLGGNGLWVARRPGFEFVQIGKGMVQAKQLADYHYIGAWVP